MCLPELRLQNRRLPGRNRLRGFAEPCCGSPLTAAHEQLQLQLKRPSVDIGITLDEWQVFTRW